MPTVSGSFAIAELQPERNKDPDSSLQAPSRNCHSQPVEASKVEVGSGMATAKHVACFPAVVETCWDFRICEQSNPIPGFCNEDPTIHRPFEAVFCVYNSRGPPIAALFGGVPRFSCAVGDGLSPPQAPVPTRAPSVRTKQCVQAWNGAIVNLQGARVDSMLRIKAFFACLNHGMPRDVTRSQASRIS